MGQLVLQGSLSAGGASGSFPTMQIQETVQFANGNPRPYGACTGMISRTIASPSSFVALGGVGASSDVAKADFLYVDCNAPILLEVTYDDGLGGSVVVVLPLDAGPFMVPVSASNKITLVRVKGAGQLEYLASGP